MTKNSNYLLLESNSEEGKRIEALGVKAELLIHTKEELSLLDTWLSAQKGEYVFFALQYEFASLFPDFDFVKADESKPLAIFWTAESVLFPDALEFETLKNTVRTESKPEPYLSREYYIERVNELKRNIQQGNIYETNFCTGYKIQNVSISEPKAFFQELNKNTEAPFSAYFKYNDFHLFCASPERFIKRTGSTLFSSPIKGTVKRGEGTDTDEALKKELIQNNKERAENIMIVDLVRHDMAKVCKAGTVEVSEYLGIHTFKTVHQLISTIQGELKENISFFDLLTALYPMGSMTGAPKQKAVELSAKLEVKPRGFYSGTIGYIEPNGDFECNVVIRSVLYDAQKQEANIQVGSAITHLSDAEQEFEECELKAKALLNTIYGV